MCVRGNRNPFEKDECQLHKGDVLPLQSVNKSDRKWATFCLFSLNSVLPKWQYLINQSLNYIYWLKKSHKQSAYVIYELRWVKTATDADFKILIWRTSDCGNCSLCPGGGAISLKPHWRQSSRSISYCDRIVLRITVYNKTSSNNISIVLIIQLITVVSGCSRGQSSLLVQVVKCVIVFCVFFYYEKLNVSLYKQETVPKRMSLSVITGYCLLPVWFFGLVGAKLTATMTDTEQSVRR